MCSAQLHKGYFQQALSIKKVRENGKLFGRIFMRDWKSNAGLLVPGLYFIILSVISIIIYVSQEVYSPVLLAIIVLSAASGVGVLIRNKAGLYIAVLSTPIILTAFVSSAVYSMNMLGSKADSSLTAYQFALIIMAILWLVMCLIVVDSRDKLKKKRV